MGKSIVFPVHTLTAYSLTLLTSQNQDFYSCPDLHISVFVKVCASAVKKKSSQLQGFCKMNCVVLNLKIPWLVNTKLDVVYQDQIINIK